MPVRPTAITRRTTFALGAAGLLATAACGTETQPAATPDDTLVDEVVEQILAVIGVAGGVPRLYDMHAAHLAALDAEAPTMGTIGGSAGRVRRAERDHQRFLVDAALRAESGPLARLLASMSAAVSQQLAVPGRLG